MGFLDHSTNNIIIDAVLTDVGRRKLADNNGNFKIAFFSLSDDEVDYTLIQQYGRTVGKEKITKNTPVFEAQTTGDIAMKYRLLTISDPTIVYLPTLTITAKGLTNNEISLSAKGGEISQSVALTAEQTITGAQTVPDGLSDSSFTIFMNDKFLKIGNAGASGNYLSKDPITNIAQYSVPSSAPSVTTNGAILQTILSVQNGLQDLDFTVYGNGSTITTVVSIVGDASGIRKDFTVKINK